MIIKHGYKNLDFYVGNKEADVWYNPPKPHALLEYQWVGNNINLENRVVIDIGSHHGHYALVLYYHNPKQLILVEGVEENLNLSKTNLPTENNIKFIHKILETPDDLLNLYNKFNPDVIKMDIERWEYKTLYHCLESLSSVDSWILELHSTKDISNEIIDRFRDLEYKLWWVNVQDMKVEEYVLDRWPYRTTLFALR